MKTRNDISPSPANPRKAPKLLAEAAFTKSMAATLMAAFEGRTEEQGLVLEVRDFGVWVVDRATNRRQFIGAAAPDKSLN